MKSAIEAARRQEQRTSDLAQEARHARERFDLYKAKTYGPTLTSFSRLRELEQARDLAETRLRRAQEAPGATQEAPADPQESPDEVES
jgi:predicted transcriptional regulator